MDPEIRDALNLLLGVCGAGLVVLFYIGHSLMRARKAQESIAERLAGIERASLERDDAPRP